ncbi:YoaK family protein [Flavobacterium gawalongense]|uniref:Uncharacterized protein n=1 Tax=Flavobacterium gawalongense TaxID=2594432 RepID=A0ABY3CKH5_9FLAO|nr:hypothetical protein [Flavobacterium gawalongense]TRX01377.1 hypothetical protein FNW33_09705 [Flavobacterium gawalongense]TRX05901.1 hypothetical protein FNW12_09790 [Flavobacterium gawalongense]
MENNQYPDSQKNELNKIDPLAPAESFASNPNPNPNLNVDSSDKYVNPKSRPKEEKQQEEVKEFFKNEFENSISDLRRELKAESQDTKKEFLTFFGLFASFMTFLSIEVQIFKTNNNINEILGISILILSFLMFFAIVLNDISKDVNGFKVFNKPMYVLTLVFLLFGCFLLYNGSSVNKKNDVLLEQNTENKKTIDSLGNEVKSLNKKIKDFKSLHKN